MPLESTMICVDNSEWMRNGDYGPNRMEAQHDAANMLCSSKTQSNPESTVGVLSMAGQGIKTLLSPTEDMGKILAALHNIPIAGKCQFSNAIQVAQLALKHRRNKKGSQRIVVFVGSPVADEEKTLTKIGISLKKNNVGIDIVSFGDIDENQTRLQALVNAATSNNNSHFVTVPPGCSPSDALISSPIVHGGDGEVGAAAGGATGSGGESFAEYGGVDPSMDPELALALRVSMEEERARQEAASKKTVEDKPAEAEPRSDGNAPTEKDGDEDLLSKALAMSMGDSSASAGTEADEDKAMQMALQMSVAQDSGASTNCSLDTEASSKSDQATNSSGNASGAPPPAPASAAAFLDPTFVNSLLSGLPGVDPNDPKIQAAMAQITEQSEGSKDEKTDDKKDEM